jgi:hypothetical protein
MTEPLQLDTYNIWDHGRQIAVRSPYDAAWETLTMWLGMSSVRAADVMNRANKPGKQAAESSGVTVERVT